MKDIILEDVVKRAIYQTAYIVHNQIQDAYNRAVIAFYDDYEPKKYIRTYSTFQGSNLYTKQIGNSHTNKGMKKGDNGFSYIVGIEISGKNIKGDPYKTHSKSKSFDAVTKNEYVFNRTFIEGIHGIYRGDKKWMGKNEDGTYKPTKEYNRIKASVPVKMKPSPDVLMNREYRKIANTIDNIFTKQLDELLEKSLK